MNLFHIRRLSDAVVDPKLMNYLITLLELPEKEKGLGKHLVTLPDNDMT